ncbi:MAG: NUDIX hydrolase [Thaumarchaeota archaeon]|nr:NUDIX hydrolase [Nitrososphaerota archaeon]
MKTRIFTTGVVLDGGKLLILKRKADDDTYPEFWDCVGGHFEKGESAEECMLREAREETGQSMKIVRGGPLIEFLDRYGRAVAIPFILKPDPKRKIVVSEHSESKWIPLNAAKSYEIVPDLAKALEAFGLDKAEKPRSKESSRRVRAVGSKPVRS